MSEYIKDSKRFLSTGNGDIGVTSWFLIHTFIHAHTYINPVCVHKNIYIHIFSMSTQNVWEQ